MSTRDDTGRNFISQTLLLVADLPDNAIVCPLARAVGRRDIDGPLHLVDTDGLNPSTFGGKLSADANLRQAAVGDAAARIGIVDTSLQVRLVEPGDLAACFGYLVDPLIQAGPLGLVQCHHVVAAWQWWLRRQHDTVQRRTDTPADEDREQKRNDQPDQWHP